MSKIITLLIINNFSNRCEGENHATGIKIKLKNNSCLNELSSFNAKPKPEKLLIKARKSLLKPLFFFLLGYTIDVILSDQPFICKELRYFTEHTIV